MMDQLREQARRAAPSALALGQWLLLAGLAGLACGLAGAAVVSALFAQTDVRAAAAELRRLCDKIAEEA